MAKVSNIGQQTKKHKRKLFAYMFAIMDLNTRMYISYGSITKSERDSFDKAMLSNMDVDIDNARLDRCYSNPIYVEKFNGKVYIIPKMNSTLNGSHKWNDIVKDFMQNTMAYMKQYHQRSNSEAGFAADKKMMKCSPEA
jgi:transposase